jgi:hypothetical protein
MTNAIRNSLTRLQQIPAGRLDEITAELTALAVNLRSEVEAQNAALTNASHADYGAVAIQQVGLLQLTQATVAAKLELERLMAAADKVLQRVWKKAPAVAVPATTAGEATTPAAR